MSTHPLSSVPGVQGTDLLSIAANAIINLFFGVSLVLERGFGEKR